MPPGIIPVAEWRPDMPDLADATSIALNVIARTAQSYGPVSGLSAYSTNALDSACLGMLGVQNVDESIITFAGTADKLYNLVQASNSWADASIGGGYTAIENWRFVQFKSLVLATDFVDAIQTYTMGVSSNFAVLSASAPRARHIAVAKTFVIVANTYDGVGGYNPARVWWSATNDPTNWPTPGGATAQQVQSDYSDLNGSFGDITGLVPNLAGCDCAIFFQRGVLRMNYVGPPDIFDFFPAENVNGTQASNSLVPFGNSVFYLGDNGFYQFDGNVSVPIGADKVDKWFFSYVNQSHLDRVVGAADVINKAILWIVPSNSSTDGTPDTLLIYRWDIQRWSYAMVPAQWISRILSFNVTLDGLSTIGFTNLDTIPFSLDSRVWLGGAPQIGGINPGGYLSYFNGTTLQAQVGSKAMQIIPSRRAFVQSARPLVNGGPATVAMSARQSYADTETFGADVAVNVIGECPQRSEGRYHRALIKVAAGASWSQMTGVDLTAIPAGER